MTVRKSSVAIVSTIFHPPDPPIIPYKSAVQKPRHPPYEIRMFEHAVLHTFLLGALDAVDEIIFSFSANRKSLFPSDYRCPPADVSPIRKDYEHISRGTNIYDGLTVTAYYRCVFTGNRRACNDERCVIRARAAYRYQWYSYVGFWNFVKFIFLKYFVRYLVHKTFL